MKVRFVESRTVASGFINLECFIDALNKTNLKESFYEENREDFRLFCLDRHTAIKLASPIEKIDDRSYKATFEVHASLLSELPDTRVGLSEAKRSLARAFTSYLYHAVNYCKCPGDFSRVIFECNDSEISVDLAGENTRFPYLKFFVPVVIKRG